VQNNSSAICGSAGPSATLSLHSSTNLRMLSLVRAMRWVEGLSIMLHNVRNVVANPGLVGAILLVAFIGLTAWTWWPTRF
jgi:hypothetical protein